MYLVGDDYFVLCREYYITQSIKKLDWLKSKYSDLDVGGIPDGNLGLKDVKAFI